MNRGLLLAVLLALVAGCSKSPQVHVLEIPELGASIDLAEVWRPADPTGSENPMGFTGARIEPAGPGRSRVAKQPRGGTEIVYVTGKFPLPYIGILGIPPPPNAKTKPTLEDCATRAFEKTFDAVSWQLSPSSLTTPSFGSRATIVAYQDRSGMDFRSEILVLEKGGICYTVTGTTSPSLWDGQKKMIEAVLGSVRPLAP